MKNIIIGIIIGGIVFTLGGVVATTAISSTNVTYQNKTVNNALDELYDKAITGKELVAAAITNKGIPTTSTDTYETMAANINSIDNNHTEINKKINNLESKHNSDIASLTGSISSLNQNLNNEQKTYSSYYSEIFHNVSTEKGNRAFIEIATREDVDVVNTWKTIEQGFPISKYPVYHKAPAVIISGSDSVIGMVRITPEGKLQVWSPKQLNSCQIIANFSYDI